MVLEIKNGFKFETELLLDGKNVFELIDFDTKKQLFSLGLSRIDKEISSVAELSKEEKEGLYLWCLTYDIHRADGIVGMVLDYYLIELIKHLEINYNGINEVRLCKAIPMSFKTMLKRELKSKVVNKAPLKTELKLYIRYKLGPLKSIFRILKTSIKYRTKEVKKLPSDTALILKPIYKSYSRLKGFPDELKQRHANIFILDSRLFTVKDYTSGEETIINPFKASVFLRALKETFSFISFKKKFIKENKARIGDYGAYLKHQSFLQSYYVKLRKLAYLELFKQLNPSSLVVSSTFGDPQKRMPLIMAKWQGVETILFSCRPFITNMRSEDRLIVPDLLNHHNSTIGDEIFIFDKPSFDHLTKSGVQKDKIKLYVPRQKPSQNNKTNNYSNSILLLFAHDSYNDGLIRLFCTLKNEGVTFHSLLFREHPNVTLTEKQLQSLKDVCPNLVAITSELWHNLKFINVLALTSNSTSGIDALSRGASLLWLPFLTEHSLQFTNMMDTLGYTVLNKMEFNQFIRNYLRNLEFVKEIDLKCRRDYEAQIKYIS
jgi:hypothetical protein